MCNGKEQSYEHLSSSSSSSSKNRRTTSSFFSPSWYTQTKADLQLQEMSNLNSTNSTLYDILVPLGIDEKGNSNVLPAFLTPTWLGLPGSLGVHDCSSQSFGESGNYTNLICDTLDNIKTICNDEEDDCISSNIPFVYAATKSTFYSDLHFQNLAFALCFYIHRHSDFDSIVNKCYSAQELIPLGSQAEVMLPALQNAADNNPLFTNFWGPSYIKDLLRTDSHFIIGDGVLSFNHKVFSNEAYADVYESLTIKHKLAEAMHLQYFHLDQNVIDLETQEEFLILYQELWKGYFFSRYGREFLTNQERKRTIAWSRHVSEPECAFSIGVAIAEICHGYDASDILGFAKYIYEKKNGVCNEFTESHYNLSQVYMNTKKTNKWNKRKKKPKKCLQKILNNV